MIPNLLIPIIHESFSIISIIHESFHRLVSLTSHFRRTTFRYRTKQFSPTTPTKVRVYKRKISDLY